MRRAKRVAAKVYIKSLEETAFMFELFRVPKLRKQQRTLIKGLYEAANIVRKDIGEKPKQYITVNKRKVVKI